MKVANSREMRQGKTLLQAFLLGLVLFAAGLFLGSSSPGLVGSAGVPDFLPGVDSANARALSIPKPRPPQARPGVERDEDVCGCWKKKKKRPR